MNLNMIKKILDTGLKETDNPALIINNVTTYYTKYELINVKQGTTLLFLWQYDKLWTVIDCDMVTTLITL